MIHNHRLFFTLSFTLFLGSCKDKTPQEHHRIDNASAPETVLGVSIQFDASDPDSIKVEQAIARCRPVIDALVSADPARRTAALRLIAACFNSRGDESSKYKLMDRAMLYWMNSLSGTKATKADRDIFVAAVSSTIAMFDGETRGHSIAALGFFLDLELQIETNDTSESLLRKWKGSDSYRKLTSQL